MNVRLEKIAGKQLDRLNEPLRTQLLTAMNGLNKEPPEGDIKKMHSGRAGYRLRSGDYRIFFDKLENIISVTGIATRGHAYKNRR
jgi:mRNA-degrading endonuclease RelE of RelBE toxin-antitoxin system